MKRILLISCALFVFLGLVTAGTARAQDDQPENGGYVFTPEELDELLAPIALYPDPLIAQILPAATFVDQIDEAARYVRQYGVTGIEDQPWDVSVMAIAHYPDILSMMDRKYDWTVSLGQAFIDQEDDVMEAIQRLRAEAEEEGNLASTPQMEVYDEDDEIRIVPADPGVIYVPQYDPAVVYVEPAPSYGFITFSIGLTIGAWLNRDCDWHRHRVFYHGWRGGGWIGRARPHIHDRRNIYINNRVAAINVNRTVLRHDTANFRNQLRNEAQRRAARPPVQAYPPRQAGAGGVTRRPAPTVAPPAERPDNRNLYRGREVKGPQPAARSGYGGYGSGREATIYRQRGQSSMESMGRFNRPQPQPTQTRRPAAPQQRPAVQQAPRPAPAAPRQAPPAGRGGGAQQQRHR